MLINSLIRNWDLKLISSVWRSLFMLDFNRFCSFPFVHTLMENVLYIYIYERTIIKAHNGCNSFSIILVSEVCWSYYTRCFSSVNSVKIPIYLNCLSSHARDKLRWLDWFHQQFWFKVSYWVFYSEIIVFWLMSFILFIYLFIEWKLFLDLNQNIAHWIFRYDSTVGTNFDDIQSRW